MAEETDSIDYAHSSLQHLQTAFYITSTARDMIVKFTVQHGLVEQVAAVTDEVVAHFTVIDDAMRDVLEMLSTDGVGMVDECQDIAERAHVLHEKTGDTLAAYEIDRMNEIRRRFETTGEPEFHLNV
jgi:hypothetical protein